MSSSRWSLKVGAHPGRCPQTFGERVLNVFDNPGDHALPAKVLPRGWRMYRLDDESVVDSATQNDELLVDVWVSGEQFWKITPLYSTGRVDG